MCYVTFRINISMFFGHEGEKKTAAGSQRGKEKVLLYFSILSEE